MPKKYDKKIQNIRNNGIIDYIYCLSVLGGEDDESK
jgi:hypothetical protein